MACTLPHLHSLHTSLLLVGRGYISTSCGLASLCATSTCIPPRMPLPAYALALTCSVKACLARHLPSSRMPYHFILVDPRLVAFAMPDTNLLLRFFCCLLPAAPASVLFAALFRRRAAHMPLHAESSSAPHGSTSLQPATYRLAADITRTPGTHALCIFC